MSDHVEKIKLAVKYTLSPETPANQRKEAQEYLTSLEKLPWVDLLPLSWTLIELDTPDALFYGLHLLQKIVKDSWPEFSLDQTGPFIERIKGPKLQRILFVSKEYLVNKYVEVLGHLIRHQVDISNFVSFEATLQVAAVFLNLKILKKVGEIMNEEVFPVKKRLELTKTVRDACEYIFAYFNHSLTNFPTCVQEVLKVLVEFSENGVVGLHVFLSYQIDAFLLNMVEAGDHLQPCLVILNNWAQNYYVESAKVSQRAFSRPELNDTLRFLSRLLKFMGNQDLGTSDYDQVSLQYHLSTFLFHLTTSNGSSFLSIHCTTNPHEVALLNQIWQVLFKFFDQTPNLRILLEVTKAVGVVLKAYLKADEPFYLQFWGQLDATRLIHLLYFRWQYLETPSLYEEITQLGLSSARFYTPTFMELYRVHNHELYKDEIEEENTINKLRPKLLDIISHFLMCPHFPQYKAHPHLPLSSTQVQEIRESNNKTRKSSRVTPMETRQYKHFQVMLALLDTLIKGDFEEEGRFLIDYPREYDLVPADTARRPRYFGLYAISTLASRVCRQALSLVVNEYQSKNDFWEVFQSIGKLVTYLLERETQVVSQRHYLFLEKQLLLLGDLGPVFNLLPDLVPKFLELIHGVISYEDTKDENLHKLEAYRLANSVSMNPLDQLTNEWHLDPSSFSYRRRAVAVSCMEHLCEKAPGAIYPFVPRICENHIESFPPCFRGSLNG